MSDLTYYAIGDVHGEIEKLDRLLEYIRVDAARLGTAHRIIFLGDLVDRGSDSRAVIERAIHATEAGEALALKGNHEELMLHAFDKRESIGIYWWAENGGDETIASYMTVNGTHDDWREAIDNVHIKWLHGLPVMVQDEARGLVFVHAGIDPWRFPNCSDEVKMWTRSQTFYRSRDWPDREELRNVSLVVHGHTPTDDFQPDVQRRRINVDTGACFGGPLTAAVLAPRETPRFLRA